MSVPICSKCPNPPRCTLEDRCFAGVTTLEFTEGSRDLNANLALAGSPVSHNACGTPDCCGTCPTAAAVEEDFARSLDLNDEAETVDDHIPAGAAAMWDHIAGTSPQYIPPWVDQSEHSRNVFIRAFSIGLETLAHAAADA